MWPTYLIPVQGWGEGPSRVGCTSSQGRGLDEMTSAGGPLSLSQWQSPSLGDVAAEFFCG